MEKRYDVVKLNHMEWLYRCYSGICLAKTCTLKMGFRTMHKLCGVDGQMWINEAIPLSIIITKEYQIVCEKKVNRLEEITIPLNVIHNSSNHSMERTMGDNNRWRCIWLINLEYILDEASRPDTLFLYFGFFFYFLLFISLRYTIVCNFILQHLLSLLVLASWWTQIRWNFGRGQFDLSIRERDDKTQRRISNSSDNKIYPNNWVSMHKFKLTSHSCPLANGNGYRTHEF